MRGERMRVVVGAVYRAPRNTSAALTADFDELEAQYQHIIASFPDSPVIICGDLNSNLLADVQSHPACKKLTQLVAAYSLTQLVTVPTYRTGSLLDVFIVNRHFNYHVGSRYCHFSPHKFIRLSCDIPRPRVRPEFVHTRLLKVTLNASISTPSILTSFLVTGVQFLTPCQLPKSGACFQRGSYACSTVMCPSTASKSGTRQPHLSLMLHATSSFRGQRLCRLKDTVLRYTVPPTALSSLPSALTSDAR